MANIPDQVDAALMAKLRLQCQSPGDEERRERLGVGRPGKVLWRTVDGGVAKSAHRRWMGAGAGLPHRRSFGCDVVGEADGRVVGKGRRRAAAGDAMAGFLVGPAPVADLTLEAEAGRERVALSGRQRQAARAVGQRHTSTRRSRRWMRMRQTREDLQPCDGTRARSLVVVGRSVEGRAHGVVGGCRGGGKLWRRAHRAFGCTDHLGGLARRAGESQGARAYGKHQHTMHRDTLERRLSSSKNIHGPENH